MRILPRMVAMVVCSALAATLSLRAQEGAITGDATKGAALLAEARKALGGADKLSAVKTVQTKGAFRRTAGNNQIEGEFEIFVQAPDKMKRIDDTSLPGGGPSITATQALNGTEVWDENTGGGRGGLGFGGPGGFGGGRGLGGGGGGFGGGRRGGQQGAAAGGQQADAAGGAPQGAGGGRNIDPEQIRQLQLRQRQGDLSRLMLVWLLSTDASAAWVGTAQSPDGTADVLELKPADGTAPTRLFLDSSTHVPLMITWQGAAPQFGRRGGGRGSPGGAGAGAPNPPAAQGGTVPPSSDAAPPPAPQAGGDAAQAPRRAGPAAQATLQMTMADYKAVNGIKLPFTITRGINGQTNEEWTVSSYKLNQTLKPNTFEQKK